MLNLNYVLNAPDHLQILAFIEDDLNTEKVNGLEIWKPSQTVLMAFFHPFQINDFSQLKCYTVLLQLCNTWFPD